MVILKYKKQNQTKLKRTYMISKEVTTSHLTLTDDGIFRVILKEGSFETLQTAEENGQALMELKGDRPPLPILIDFSLGAGQDQAARKYYAEQSRNWCSRAAILVGSPVSRVMGNIYMGLNKPNVPTKLFTDEQTALIWLKSN